MFRYVMSIAAFGFVAFVLVFVRPAPQARRTAAQQIAAGSAVATAHVVIGGVRAPLAAAK